MRLIQEEPLYVSRLHLTKHKLERRAEHNADFHTYFDVKIAKTSQCSILSHPVVTQKVLLYEIIGLSNRRIQRQTRLLN